MNKILNDLRSAARRLRRAPGFALASIVTLSLAIGANVALFALVDAILLRPLPYPESDRLVVVQHTAPGLDMDEAGLSDGMYLHYRAHNRVFEDVGAYYENVVNLTGEGDAERVHVAMATHSLFSTLRVQPVLGRLFTEEDGRDDASVPVLISHGLWQRRYGADPEILGRRIEINGSPRQVVGVLQAGFGFPRRETEIWYPSTPDPTAATFSDFYYSAVARLKPGVSAERAIHDLDRLIPSLADAYADATPALLERARLQPLVQPLKTTLVGEVRVALLLLLGGMGVVLLIACANVGNLFLVRAESRRREIAIRLALGAGRERIVRTFLSESMFLAVIGGILGLVLGYVGVRALVAFGPEALPRLHEVGVDGRTVIFTILVSILVGLLLGAVSLLHFGGPEVVSALKQGGHGATVGQGRRRIRSALVAAQMALALVLLVGSALMAQSYWRLSQVDLGFDPEGVLTMELPLPYRAYPEYADAAAFWDRLLARIRTLPGVEAAGAVSGLPLVSLPAYYEDPIAVEARPSGPDGALPTAPVYFVTPGYFEALRIPVEEGRFPAGGRVDAPHPVLMSAALAHRLFPQERPLGARVQRSPRPDKPWNTVVGITGDVPKTSVEEGPLEVLYLPVLGRAVDPRSVPRSMSLAVRSTLPSSTLMPSIRRIVREIDPDLPIANVRTMERIVADSMARTSLTMALLWIAATAALLLGAVGLFGLVSYATRQRTQEIGIRLALGAPIMEVRGMIVRQGAGLALVGLAIGCGASLVLTRFLGSLLFEVSPTDPITLASMALLLFAVAVVASALPAWKAARADPMVALRSE